MSGLRKGFFAVVLWWCRRVDRSSARFLVGIANDQAIRNHTHDTGNARRYDCQQ